MGDNERIYIKRNTKQAPTSSSFISIVQHAHALHDEYYSPEFEYISLEDKLILLNNIIGVLESVSLPSPRIISSRKNGTTDDKKSYYKLKFVTLKEILFNKLKLEAEEQKKNIPEKIKQLKRPILYKDIEKLVTTYEKLLKFGCKEFLENEDRIIFNKTILNLVNERGNKDIKKSFTKIYIQPEDKKFISLLTLIEKNYPSKVAKKRLNKLWRTWSELHKLKIPDSIAKLETNKEYLIRYYRIKFITFKNILENKKTEKVKLSKTEKVKLSKKEIAIFQDMYNKLLDLGCIRFLADNREIFDLIEEFNKGFKKSNIAKTLWNDSRVAFSKLNQREFSDSMDSEDSSDLIEPSKESQGQQHSNVEQPQDKNELNYLLNYITDIENRYNDHQGDYVIVVNSLQDTLKTLYSRCSKNIKPDPKEQYEKTMIRYHQLNCLLLFTSLQLKMLIDKEQNLNYKNDNQFKELEESYAILKKLVCQDPMANKNKTLLSLMQQIDNIINPNIMPMQKKPNNKPTIMFSFNQQKPHPEKLAQLRKINLDYASGKSCPKSLWERVSKIQTNEFMSIGANNNKQNLIDYYKTKLLIYQNIITNKIKDNEALNDNDRAILQNIYYNLTQLNCDDFVTNIKSVISSAKSRLNLSQITDLNNNLNSVNAYKTVKN